ncbi:TonB-dependent receptor plug domain-containing protein [Stenotrophomonas chelatiphaga]|uniref:TonB-dependent receptor plug domain-containing protein n=1 Tax=Stenotrophomonas chelatiphaga TaxID=517011 RepID=UPI001FE215FD|nr:TonB-dependent receptor [Stenotrophomonas chelatiphaga]MCS4230550.1 iron complex outermembrane receptor protein [Stenotrophomonas chelatiphaga]
MALATALLVTSAGALAQESPATPEAATNLDTVSVLGSRTKPRTVSSSAVPIDIISGEEFRNQGATDALDQLKVLVPSFNVSTIPIDDAASLVRPANLRGLPPDNTLLLVNGKRFHRAAVITFLGHGLSDGAQGPDLSVFPSLALEQVEVLRDGAAAQYGSDAIAGVINFGLKKLREGGTAEVFTGKYYEGDGLTTQYSAQIGLPLTERGFATLTAEWRNADDTSRSVQRDDAAAAIAAGYPGVGQPAQVWGSPKVDDDFKLVYNLGLSTDSVDFYLFGNHAKRDVDGGFYFRDPTSRSGVYSNDGGDTLLVGNLTGAGACPSIALRDGGGNLLPYAGVSAAVAALPANCYTFLSSLPGGFTPRFGGSLEDTSVFAGAKGTWEDWYWDVSGSWGRNEIDFTIYNTVNASMGPVQPAGLSFKPGGNTQTEKNLNVDVSRDIAVGFSSQPLRLAMGAEWREESFTISPGDGPSTAIGPLTEQGFALGSNGFNGFSARTAGTFDRRNWAAYADLEAQLTERFLLAGALRYEDYDSFGSTTTGKLTGRFDFTETFAVRGAYNTGFRAPTPGQANISQISTVFGGTALEDIATLPPTDPIAQLKGAQPLTPEESRNVSLGAVWTQGDWLFTVDGYQIKVEDRIALSTSFAVTPAERAALVAGGNPEAASISQVTYFGNAFDTTTTGVDVVTSYRSDHFGGTTTYALAANWNRTEVDRYDTDFIDAARVYKLEKSLPRTKGYFSVNHQRQIFHANLRFNYYSSWYEDHLDSGVISAADGGLPIHAGSALIVDAEVGWKFVSGLYFSVGAQNLFDRVPSKNPWAGVAGAEYPVHSPYGFNGGFYYARLGWKF